VIGKIYFVEKIYKEMRMELKRGKKFYGSVTVSERGQIAIPAQARVDFGIKTGDKLLVLADLEKGIVLAKANFVLGLLEGTVDAADKLGRLLRQEGLAGEPEDGSGES
jgi:AbrB family looped-hinge helix DNA binding protein